MKVVNIKFYFPPEDWERAKKFYSDKEIRQILAEGGEGELSELLNDKEAHYGET
jgi:hypothetical protein